MICITRLVPTGGEGAAPDTAEAPASGAGCGAPFVDVIGTEDIARRNPKTASRETEMDMKMLEQNQQAER